MNAIYFFNADATVNIKNKSAIRNLVGNIFREENVSLERINYIFCSDDYLLGINRQYLKHDTFTDIITFPLSETGKPIVGEIYISLQRVKENAKTYKAEYHDELLRVIIHGALHLCGYKDKTKTEKGKMRAKENYHLEKFNVSREANS